MVRAKGQKMVRSPFYLFCRDWLECYLSVTFMMGDDANGGG